MIKKHAVSCTLILTFLVVLALALSSTFLGLERAWADSVIKTITVGFNPNGIAFNPTNNDLYVTNFGSNTVSVIATTTPVQPPTQTTITSATDGKH